MTEIKKEVRAWRKIVVAGLNKATDQVSVVQNLAPALNHPAHPLDTVIAAETMRETTETAKVATMEAVALQVTIVTETEIGRESALEIASEKEVTEIENEIITAVDEQIVTIETAMTFSSDKI